MYCKTCVKWPLSKRPKIGFQDQLTLMQVKNIAILLTFIKLPIVFSLLYLFLSGRFTQINYRYDNLCFYLCRPQLTSMLSLCHRVTGIAMAASECLL